MASALQTTPIGAVSSPARALRPSACAPVHALRVAGRASLFAGRPAVLSQAAPAAGHVVSRTARGGAVCSLSRPAAAVADGQGKLTILVAEKLGKAGIDMLRAYGTVVEAFDMSQADLCAKVSLCDALIVRSATKVRSDARQRIWAHHHLAAAPPAPRTAPLTCALLPLAGHARSAPGRQGPPEGGWPRGRGH
jgi:hypothetical protein